MANSAFSKGTPVGSVIGPASATDNAIARFDATTGKLIQEGTLSASDVATGAVTLASIGDNDLVLETGNATTGSIIITDGANGRIYLTPDGTGRVQIDGASGQALLRLDQGTESFGIGGAGDMYGFNGNQVLGFEDGSSRVNYFSIASASTGSGPELKAAGTDTNINIELHPKGTGKVLYGTKEVDVIPETTSEASNATPAPIGSGVRNEHYITALAANATFSAPSGTVANGNSLIIRIKDNATARTLAWNAIYAGLADSLPTTTTISKVMYLGFKYNSTSSAWELVALNTEA